MTQLSALQIARKAYQPKLPPVLRKGPGSVQIKFGAATESVADQAAVKALFPKTYGQPVAEFVAGLLQAGRSSHGGRGPLRRPGAGRPQRDRGNPRRTQGDRPQEPGPGLSGGTFGPRIRQVPGDHPGDHGRLPQHRRLRHHRLGRTKLETEEQFLKCKKVLEDLKVDAVVIIGGDDSNTNAAVLAEWFKAQGSPISVVGCPKTIDGDLKNAQIPTSFGFDTAAKTYSELIGNIERDCLSAKKYWHFIKIMGRSASHLALEAGLQTQPNLTLISEEIEKKNETLAIVVSSMADLVDSRAGAGKNFGVAVIPEGLVEFMPDVKKLIATLNDLMAHEEKAFEAAADQAAKEELLKKHLPADVAATYFSLPFGIRGQLLLDRDPHGNVQVSRIETEKLLGEMVAAELKKRGSKAKFSFLTHFFGYEGRCAAPSNFDADYCYSLGYVAALLVNGGKTGYMATCSNLTKGIENWKPGGIPVTQMMNIERRHGHDKPVIRKALVELDGAPFKKLEANRKLWAETEAYVYPGPIQYWGPTEVCDATTKTLELEQG
jgi:pyrophosphate--fructose-6-phosphate 1-phosphotransferase